MRAGTSTSRSGWLAGRGRRRLGAACAVAGAWFLVGAPGALAASPCGNAGVLTTAGATETCTYTTTGQDTFSVPAGVSSLDVIAVGGQGGGNPHGYGGGFGGQVSADLAVQGGAGLYVEVGGNGADGVGGDTTYAGGAGGLNGGAVGGAGGTSTSAPDGGGGGGGGGASDLRSAPASAGLSPDPRLIVAGGGGGGALDEVAGGTPGVAGGTDQSSGGGGGGGGGGTASAGGASGVGGAGEVDLDYAGATGQNGALGVGGAGGNGGDLSNPSYIDNGGDGGGGGGGGYYGGGGGGGGGAADDGAAGGGGGGSDYVAPSATNATFAIDSTGVPSITISWTTPAPPVAHLADLSVSITGASKAADGASFSEAVKVANAGPAAATGVITGLVVPNGLTVTGAGGGSRLGPAIYWSDGSIASGASVTYTVTLKVNAGARGSVLIGAATASTQVKDPDYLNNAAVTVVALGSGSAPATSADHAGAKRDRLATGRELVSRLEHRTLGRHAARPERR